MIHITCNMGSRDLPDMYALSPWDCGPRALGIHIRQIPPAHVTTYTSTEQQTLLNEAVSFRTRIIFTKTIV